MPQAIMHFEQNIHGRDFAVGDIHGCFSRLRAALQGVGFDQDVDRLFSVGDLVDRGPECEDALAWLAQPWFHAVQGNHEDIAIRYARGNPVDRTTYGINGGDWFMALDPQQQARYAAAFAALPYALQVQTQAGLVGLLHADCPRANWSDLDAALRFNRTARDRCMWSRERLQRKDTRGVANVRAVVVGHTPLQHPIVLGNVYHIDTGGWMPNGYFTLLNLETLEWCPRSPLA